MELRRCSTLHFIQTIREGVVVKVCNVNSHGKPALAFKALKDIYETKDAKGSNSFTSLNSPEQYADSVCGFGSVQSESQSLPVADRTLREIGTENNEFICSGSDDKDYDSDSNDYMFSKMTLKQLKKKCKSKKRKLPTLCDISPKQEDVDSQQEEDEDLEVPLSVYKTKLSKNSKTKRKCTKRSTFPCSKTAISVKTEQILDSDITVQFKGDSASLINVKSEVTEHEFSSCPSTSSLASFPSELPVLSDVVLLPSAELDDQAHKPEFSGHQSTNSFTDCSSINCNEEFSCSGLISTEVPETIEVHGNGPMLYAEEHQCCTLNDVSTNDNMECVEPTIEVQGNGPMLFADEQQRCTFNDVSTNDNMERVEPTIEVQGDGLMLFAEEQRCALDDVSTNDNMECVEPTIGVQGNGPMLFVEEQQCCILNDVSTNDNMRCVEPTIEVQGNGPMLFAEEQQCCTLNDVSTNDNMECVEPTIEVQGNGSMLFVEEQQCCTLNDVSTNDNMRCVEPTIEVQGNGPMLFAEEQQCCTLNDVSTNDNMECVEPTIEVLGNGPMLFAEEQQCRTLNDASTNDNMVCVELHPHGGPLEIVLPSGDENVDMHLKLHVISGQNSCNFESHVSDATLTGKVDSADIHHAGDIYMPEDEAKEEFFPTEQNVSTTRPLENIFSSGGSEINSNTCDDLLSVKASPSSLNQLSNYSSADTTNSCLNHDAPQSKLTKVDGKKSPSTVEEKSYTMKNQYSNVASMVSTSELQRTPERLPCKRKAISPSSQAGLCQAMNCADLFDEAENYKCKEKLLVGPDVVSRGTDENSELSPPVRQPKVIIKRHEIAKRLKISRKVSPHRGNSDSPHFSRSPPQLSTGCTSIDSCSESAIAFSQRQMHDFESLAMKLMDELKSMKDMVEEKLLFEAYRNVYLKNDADEVRNALNNTKKVEETAKKWLSLMTRDCTRFCKVMEMQKLNQNCGPSSRGTVQKERKITFADEAGGMLCSVNYFDNAVSSPVLPSDENQEG